MELKNYRSKFGPTRNMQKSSVHFTVRENLQDAGGNSVRFRNISDICKIGDFHDDDYEECRLLGYKKPFRTSQETHYISTTEPSQLMLCKI
jgi:hypothetical protein